MKTAIWITALVLGLLITVPWAVQEWMLKLYRMPGAAMEPTLKCAAGPTNYACTGTYSDRFAVAKLAFLVREPGRGDVVAFALPERGAARCGFGGTHVHRIVGVPGETVRVRRGVVHIDATPLPEPYVRRRDSDTRPPRRLGDDEFYVLGDNRPQSCDSRIWGPVTRDALIGLVVWRYWPPDRWGEV